MSHSLFPNSGVRAWNVNRLPDLSGKTYLITGGNQGLGFEAGKHLGRKGANLILASRSADKARRAASDLETRMKGNVHIVQLDLSDLSSVRKAAEDVHQRFKKIDGLINNAGVMQTPELKTKDGFEMQMGTNHLGHFLFTGLLLGLVEAAAGRIVTLTSIANRSGAMNLDDLMSSRHYTPTGAYVQSKLANLIFALDLDRRLKEANSTAISIGCHPGYSNTGLQSSGPAGLLNIIYKITNPLFAQPPAQGALPTVLSAAGTEARRGHYYGPGRMREFRGLPGDAKIPDGAKDQAVWKRLWDMSEDLVSFKWTIPAK
ncbi:MAG: SDR family NAD(P)-dependent oxidoreductase [Rhodobacteraceae bacterium]|nr:SDR family NAD(P)-dependent oxidoreductase [Paracoccaceae bacterium]